MDRGRGGLKAQCPAARETVQMHIGAASLQPDPKKYLSADFGALLETMGLLAGVKLKSENADVKSGLLAMYA
jgi:3-hydroxyisobutyrate dehydrogenase